MSDSIDCIFEARTADGIVKDRFAFFGPIDLGFELAEKRGALYDAPRIGCLAA